MGVGSLRGNDGEMVGCGGQGLEKGQRTASRMSAVLAYSHRRNMVALSKLGVSWNWALDCFRVRRVGVYWVLLSVREDGLVDGPEGDWRHGKVETQVRRGG